MSAHLSDNLGRCSNLSAGHIWRGARGLLLTHLGSDCPTDLSSYTGPEPLIIPPHIPVRNDLRFGFPRSHEPWRAGRHYEVIIGDTPPPFGTSQRPVPRAIQPLLRDANPAPATFMPRIPGTSEPASAMIINESSATPPGEAFGFTRRDVQVAAQLSAIHGRIDELARQLSELARLTRNAQETEGNSPA